MVNDLIIFIDGLDYVQNVPECGKEGEWPGDLALHNLSQIDELSGHSEPHDLWTYWVSHLTVQTKLSPTFGLKDPGPFENFIYLFSTHFVSHSVLYP